MGSATTPGLATVQAKNWFLLHTAKKEGIIYPRARLWYLETTTNQMGWVKDALRELESTGQCQIRPFGGSMRGRIESGQRVSMKVCSFDEIKEGDIVFVKWKGNYLLHLVKAIRADQLLIGNNLGKINGWIPKKNLLAKVIQVHEDTSPI